MASHRSKVTSKKLADNVKIQSHFRLAVSQPNFKYFKGQTRLENRYDTDYAAYIYTELLFWNCHSQFQSKGINVLHNVTYIGHKAWTHFGLNLQQLRVKAQRCFC